MLVAQSDVDSAIHSMGIALFVGNLCGIWLHIGDWFLPSLFLDIWCRALTDVVHPLCIYDGFQSAADNRTDRFL